MGHIGSQFSSVRNTGAHGNKTVTDDRDQTGHGLQKKDRGIYFPNL